MPEETQDPQQADEQAQPQADDQTPQEPQGEALPEIGVDVADAGTLRKKLTITVPRGRIDAKLDEMFGELARTAQVPGFRIGRAPRRLIEKRFGREVSEDVRNALVGESLGDAIKKAELKTLGEPDLDLDSIELPEAGEMTYSFEVEVAPEFALPELEGIAVEKRLMDVTDERIDGYIDQLRQARARYETTSEAAAEGDTVTADAKITGEGIDDHERKGLTLRVAPGQVEGLPLVDLPKAVAGKKAGEPASLTTRVADAHPNELWRGKEVTVELAITEVRRRVLPELNDEFAASSGFDSVDDLRKFVATTLTSRVAQETNRAMRGQVRQYLLDHTEFDLPDGVVQRQTDRVLQRRYIDLLYQGIPRETIDERITELQAAAAEQAKQDVKLQFILAKVADQLEIEVSDSEVNARVAEMAAQYNRRPERLRHELEQDGTLGMVEVALREEKALDALLEKAQVTEVSEAELRKRMEKATQGDEKEKKPKQTKKKAAAKKTTKKTAKKTAKKKTARDKKQD